MLDADHILKKEGVREFKLSLIREEKKRISKANENKAFNCRRLIW